MKPFKTYLNRYFPFEGLLGNETVSVETGPSAFNQQKVSRTKQAIITALRVSPWFCGGGLFLALASPFLLPALGIQLASSVHIFGQDVTIQGLITLIETVTVGGLIGFGTNKLAIRMLFRPLQKRPIWGQGMIPAQRDAIIDSLARGMHKHILSQKLIRKRIEDSGLIQKLNDILFKGTTGILKDDELRGEVKKYLSDSLNDYFHKDEVRKELYDLIDKKVEEKAEKGIKKLVFSTYKRINRDDYDALIEQVITDIPESILEVASKLEAEVDTAVDFIQNQRRATELYMLRYTMNLLNRMDIKALLAKQMEHFNEERLEQMVWEATNEQLLYIQYLGTILGMLGGLIIWNSTVMVPVYLGLFGLLYILDEVLFRFKKKKETSK
ncbi:DUF445 domain-containing protein [bacterium]|nr:DUF445 domain-containing protein [bacterium]